MINSANQADSAKRRSELVRAPESIVFSGDGEPQSPESIVGRLNSMLTAGDLHPDTYSLGGSVEAFERRMADELGKEAAIWMPTGTLANHLALRRHSGINARVVLQEQSHIYQDEGDALARLSGLNAIPLAKGKPYFTVAELQEAMRSSVTGRVLNPVGAVSIESPVRRQAGQILPWDEMQSITRICKQEGIPVHLDGARLYMMSASTGVGVKEYSELFDSVYISTWKYFGSPFGAILAGTSEFIDGMFHDRRMFGGGLPSGYLATALSMNGIDGFVDRFSESLTKAKALFANLNKLPGIEIHQFEHGSNVFELRLGDDINTDQFVESLLDFKIVIPWLKSEWPLPLLHVNSSILRRSNDEIVEAFTSVLSARL
jgi:threonine aldolase